MINRTMKLSLISPQLSHNRPAFALQGWVVILYTHVHKNIFFLKKGGFAMNSSSQGQISWVKVAAVTVVVGVVAFLASPEAPLGGFWGAPAEVGPEPTGFQTLLFILIGLLQSFVFGLGIAFVIFGYRLISAAPVSEGLALATYLSIAWSLINWWPHSNFHQTASGDINSLLAIEYGFHVTSILAGLIIAYFFVEILRQGVLRPARA
jgi:hypothetical protein